MDRIPFNVPQFFSEEIANIRKALENRHISGNGPFTQSCEQWLGHRLGVPRVLLTTSCTDALELAALLLDLQPNDEVILPSYTFVSTANAFVLHGARPVFADIRPDTLNIDHERIESLISPRTRAIVVVHYAGVACEMDPILKIAASHGLPVIEDNAHGLFGRYRGRDLGTLGALATLSFHETKNVSCGEGGALLINDARFAERAEIVREKGTNRSRFLRGQVDKYTWVDKGSSFLPSDLLAAVLRAQLDHAEEIQKKRQAIWQTYYDGLSDWSAAADVKLPHVPPHCEQAFHLFSLRMPHFEARNALIEHLKKEGIHAVFHYVPLHSSPMGLRLSHRPAECPIAEATSSCLVRLPFFYGLTVEQQQRVIGSVRRFRP